MEWQLFTPSYSTNYSFCNYWFCKLGLHLLLHINQWLSIAAIARINGQGELHLLLQVLHHHVETLLRSFFHRTDLCANNGHPNPETETKIEKPRRMAVLTLHVAKIQRQITYLWKHRWEKKFIAWFSECRTEAWYGTLVAQFGAEFTSRVIQTAAFSGTSTVNLQAGMVLCALGHQHMQRAHFWARKVLVDVGCTVPNKHKWEIRTNTVCG